MALFWHILYFTYTTVSLTCVRKFVPYSSENALEPIYQIGRYCCYCNNTCTSYRAYTGYRICSALSTTKPLRMGYFPNINHAPTGIGFGSGNFQNRRHVLQPRPNCKWVWTAQGKDRKIISSVVIVLRRFRDPFPKNFADTIFASPQLGNRHTLALRKNLQDNGFKTKNQEEIYH